MEQQQQRFVRKPVAVGGSRVVPIDSEKQEQRNGCDAVSSDHHHPRVAVRHVIHNNNDDDRRDYSSSSSSSSSRLSEEVASLVREMHEEVAMDRILEARKVVDAIESLVTAVGNNKDPAAAAAAAVSPSDRVTMDAVVRESDHVRKMLDDLESDETWTLVHASKHDRDVTVHYRNSEGSPIHCVKTAAVFANFDPIDFARFCSLFLESDLFRCWFPRGIIDRTAVLAKPSKYRQVLKMDFSFGRFSPLSDRDAVVEGRGYHLTDENAILVVSTSVTASPHCDIPKPADKVIRTDMSSAFYIQLLPGRRAVFRQVSHDDLKIRFVPAAVLNFIAQGTIPYEIVQSIRCKIENFHGSVWHDRMMEKSDFYKELQERVERELLANDDDDDDNNGNNQQQHQQQQQQQQRRQRQRQRGSSKNQIESTMKEKDRYNHEATVKEEPDDNDNHDKNDKENEYTTTTASTTTTTTARGGREEEETDGKKINDDQLVLHWYLLSATAVVCFVWFVARATTPLLLSFFLSSLSEPMSLPWWSLGVSAASAGVVLIRLIRCNNKRQEQQQQQQQQQQKVQEKVRGQKENKEEEQEKQQQEQELGRQQQQEQNEHQHQERWCRLLDKNKEQMSTSSLETSETEGAVSSSLLECSTQLTAMESSIANNDDDDETSADRADHPTEKLKGEDKAVNNASNVGVSKKKENHKDYRTTMSNNTNNTNNNNNTSSSSSIATNSNANSKTIITATAGRRTIKSSSSRKILRGAFQKPASKVFRSMRSFKMVRKNNKKKNAVE